MNKKAKNVLILNLTRFGDLLQSQQAIDDLHLAGCTVGLICLENFAPAAALLRNVSQVWHFPGSKIMADLDRNWVLAANDLLVFTREIIQQFQPSHILNLTPTLPARLLARLAKDSETVIMGFGMDEYGFGINSGVWASFLSVASQKRINSPFNLATLLRKLALPLSLEPQGSFRLATPTPEMLGQADQFIATHSGNFTRKPTGYVAFQLGASEDRRRWPVDHFRQLGQELWEKRNICPILLGSAAEAPLAQHYGRGARHPFINAVGATDIPALAALLLKCRLLVTNDTGTMHLASGLGVPSLAFFLATAQPWDTGPVLPGCCCLEPAIPCHPCSYGNKCEGAQCRGAISARVAADLVLGWLEHGRWEDGLSESAKTGCRIWLTGEDAQGMPQVRRIAGQEEDQRGSWLALLREFWSHVFDEIESPNGNLRLNRPPDAWHLPDKSQAMPDAAKISPNLTQAAQILDTLKSCGALVGKSKDGAKLFLLNCERIHGLLESSPYLATLAAFWREFSQSHGSDFNRFLTALPILAGNFRKLADMAGKS